MDNLASTDKWKNLSKRRYVDYLHRDAFLNQLRRGDMPWRLDAIIHLGACSSTTERNADFLMENNFHYTRDLCRYALNNGIRFITASSAATYGDGSQGFSDDPAGIPALRPLNMYGYSKQLFDMWLLRKKAHEAVASLKFFNVYGPNEYHKGDMKSVICKAREAIRAEGVMRLFASDTPDYADGGQLRDFVYVKDCVKLMAWLLEHPEAGGIHNVGTGRARTWNDLAHAVFDALNLPPRIEYIPMPEQLRGRYQRFTQADMRWLETVRYPYPLTELEDGVREYVCDYLEQADPYL